MASKIQEQKDEKVEEVSVEPQPTGINTDYEQIIVTQDGSIVEVRLNRPQARNAWTNKMKEELDSLLIEAAEDPSVRVLTLRGEGPSFSAGRDLKEVAEDKAQGRNEPTPVSSVPKLERAWYFPKPIIAGVHGYVGPVALKYLAYCDFIIAAQGTRFSCEQTRRGGGSPTGNPLVFYFPPRVWKKLVMMGGWFDEEQALQLHFVQRVVAPENLEHEVRRWAEQIAKIPAAQLAAAKLGIHRQYELMGLTAMELTRDRRGGHGTEEHKAFFRAVVEKGLKEALKDRDAGFDAEIARI